MHYHSVIDTNKMCTVYLILKHDCPRSVATEESHIVSCSHFILSCIGYSALQRWLALFSSSVRSMCRSVLPATVLLRQPLWPVQLRTWLFA